MCRERSLKCKNEERGDGEEGKLFLFSLPPPPSIFHFFYSPSNVPAITRLKTERFLRWLVPCTWLEVCLCGCFQGEETEVWARPLYDGSVAIALFSRAQYRGTMFASFEMVSTVCSHNRLKKSPWAVLFWNTWQARCGEGTKLLWAPGQGLKNNHGGNGQASSTNFER